MIQTELTTNRRAKKIAKVYVLEGFNAEALLGYEDAEELGFITLSHEGRDPTGNERKELTIQKVDINEDETP